MRRFAFTLSELLIALVIVGVVAVLTIPNVTKNIYTKSNVAKLQATYKTLSDAVTNMMVEERINNLDDSSLFSDTKGDFFSKYLKVTSDCGASYVDCLPDTYKSIYGEDVDESEFLFADEDSTDSHYAKLPSGAVVGFFKKGTDQAIFVVDVNGKDAPNVVGLDLFAFGVYSDGSLGTSYYDEFDDIEVRRNNCLNGVDYGQPCFSELQASGWVMDY